MAATETNNGHLITTRTKGVSHEKCSQIQKFFADKTIFITGSTGFLGKILLEKLLRSCSGMKKVFILVREKKGQSSAQRFKELFDVPAFEPLKNEQPNFTEKIFVVNGDCSQPCMGISEEDRNSLINNVDCIFHLAATVRFDAHLRKAAYVNVRAVVDLVKMAKQMEQLQSFVYVSTAYSNSPTKDIDEVFYEPTISPQNLLSVVECLNDEMLDAITPALIGEWPNTYTFSKSIAEDVIAKQGQELPLAIVRPSIIIGCFKEPIPGWIDNVYAASGVIAATGAGVLRTMRIHLSKRADVVPADYVVNSVISAAWDVGVKKTPHLEQSRREKGPVSELPIIYNYVCGVQNPLTWGKFMKTSVDGCKEVLPSIAIWHVFLLTQSNKYYYELCKFLLHTMPAYVVDFLALCAGKKPILVETYKKVHKFSDVLTYFTTNEWNFKDDNLQFLWNKLSLADKIIFPFDIGAMPWDKYFDTYLLGIRIYLMNDPLETLPKARRKKLMFQTAHYTLVTVFFLLLFAFLRFIWNFLLN